MTAMQLTPQEFEQMTKDDNNNNKKKEKKEKKKRKRESDHHEEQEEEEEVVVTKKKTHHHAGNESVDTSKPKSKQEKHNHDDNYHANSSSKTSSDHKKEHSSSSSSSSSSLLSFKHHARSFYNSHDTTPSSSTTTNNNTGTSVKDKARKHSHALKRMERKEIMETLPKVDQDGIAYTKLQLRRMMKRVKKGLDPIETPHEVEERKKREAELKREEETEFAGLAEYSKKETKHVDGASDQEDASDDDDDDNERHGSAPSHTDTTTSSRSPTKKRRTKPIPSDYVCMACQNKHSPQHWIYDCPSKVTVRGVNQVSKNLKGVHNPDYKVFVSGLPFDTKQADLMSMFEHCGKIVQCKLVQFKDTKRCKGNAYIAFDSKENTLKAIKMNGLKQTLKDGKQLTLKVTKALSRALTKKEETKSGKTQNVETTATADVANEEE